MEPVGTDYDEHSPLRDAYRAQLRALTEARQATEKAKAVPCRDPEVRRTIGQAYKVEMARIEAEHQAWLMEHNLVEPPTRRRGGRLPAYF